MIHYLIQINLLIFKYHVGIEILKFTFYYKDYKNKEDLKCFVDKQTFENRFHHNSYNLFLNFSDELWENIVIAGGFVSDCINPRKKIIGKENQISIQMI